MAAKKLGWVSQAIRSFILDKGQPIWFFVPMALPESKEWSIFVAGRMQSLDFVFYEGSAVFDRKRGDELYYAYPLTPDGKPADLTDLGLSGRKGWYVVNEGVTESEVSL